MILNVITWISWGLVALGSIILAIYPYLLFDGQIILVLTFLALVPVFLWIDVPRKHLETFNLSTRLETIGSAISGTCMGVIFISIIFAAKLPADNILLIILPVFGFLSIGLFISALISTKSFQRLESACKRTPSSSLALFLSFLVPPLGLFYLKWRFNKMLTVNAFV